MQMIPYSTQLIDDDDIAAVVGALRAPLLTQGELVERFESELARFLGVRHVVSFNSATSALYAAYAALLPAGSLAITTPISFVATANMLLACGCEPIFADVDSRGNLCPHSVEAALAGLDSSERSKVRAIVSVDLAGSSVDVAALREIATAHDLHFISDSSHAFGASVDGRRVGSLADASIFSFHAIKPITTAEGGAISTDSSEIYERAKLVRAHGLHKGALWETEVGELGFNFRLNELQAALGLSQLNKIDTFLARREAIAKRYDELFALNPHFTPTHPLIPSNHTSTNHLYPILLRPHLLSAKREIFTRALELGLGVQVHYKPIFLYELYANARKIGGENALGWYDAELSLPCHQGMSDEQVEYCAKSIVEICENLAR